MPAAKKRKAEDDVETIANSRPKRAKTQNKVEDDDTEVTVKATATKSKKTTAKKSAKKEPIESDDSIEEKPKTTKKTASQAKKSASSDSSKKDDSKEEEPELVPVNTDFSNPKLASGELKIVSWNVAGMAAIMKKGFPKYLQDENPDIICLQETKISQSPTNFPGYHAYFFPCSKPGLHGTGLLTKIEPIKVDKVTSLDDEGRVLVAEFENFHLLNTYVPNSGMKLERLSYRMKWDEELRALIKDLEKTKPVIWCGDLNVAHSEIDLANPKTNKKTAGFTQQERDSFQKTIDMGLVDSYRKFHPDEVDCYSFWTYRHGSRAKNVGWRMDYFMVSEKAMPRVTNSYIRKHILGSECVSSQDSRFIPKRFSPAVTDLTRIFSNHDLISSHCPIVIHLKK